MDPAGLALALAAVLYLVRPRQRHPFRADTLRAPATPASNSEGGAMKGSLDAPGRPMAPTAQEPAPADVPPVPQERKVSYYALLQACRDQCKKDWAPVCYKGVLFGNPCSAGCSGAKDAKDIKDRSCIPPQAESAPRTIF